MMGLLLPAALIALASLLVPLTIHLARRNQQHLTEFAALRWLRQLPRPRQRIRLDEWPLLLLRLLLLALVAVWLARPVLHVEEARTSWFVAVPGVDVEPVLEAAGGGGEVRWLAPGFPGIEQPVGQRPPPFASLLRQLDAELPVGAALTVFVPEHLESADAAIPVLSRPIDWRVLPGVMAAAEDTGVAMPALHIVHAEDRVPALRYLRAAMHAWQADEVQAPAEPSVVPLPASGLPAPDTVTLVWLAPGPLPVSVEQWIGEGGVALLDAEAEFGSAPVFTVMWRDMLGASLAEGARYGSGRVLRLTRPLVPAAMPQLLEADFPQRLRELLRPQPAPARVDARAHAPVHAPEAHAAAQPRRPLDLQPWWALLVALMLLAERWLATSRRRGVAP